MCASHNKLQSDRTHLGFARAVQEAFAFLAGLGFSQVEASPTIVRYRKDELRVDVYHGRYSYELGFEITRQGTKYTISEFIRATDAEVAGRYRNFAATTQEGLKNGLAKLAALAKQYAGPAIQGDPEFFGVLEKQRKLWWEAYDLDVLERQLRPKADEAFRRGNYAEAAVLYERIAPRLSPAGLKKLAIANDRARRQESNPGSDSAKAR